MGELAKALGSNIRKKRKEEGFSQEAFALAVGIDRSYMGRIERGEVRITVEKLYELAVVLHCEPASLLPAQDTL
ncbi:MULTISPECIES: helix-turn-helix domain-containing protein [unclassified Halomonas]|uniref:helix-turn-helix domain-containing protein n=1 Tax=Halomonas sp. IOP_14 TaxID=2873295 RepID=UPI001E4ABBD4|nr:MULTISPECIES: helix-turn-helix transcriptional regulator [unclassified Halomonas]MCD1587373.1 helix-turn-helix domain-containing protein [Halomonas sp. IOP_14]UTD54546.1 helix-turn-helix domain-containing protein [Halomonas sp. MS1]